MKWNVAEDSFGFSTKFEPTKDTTKRSMLSILASIFDPFGFLTPVLMPAKKLFQHSCRLQLDWDTPVAAEIASAWKKWETEVTNISNYKIARCLAYKD